MRQQTKLWSAICGQRLESAAGDRPRALQPPAMPTGRSRRGITLIELLVVMLIMLMVTAAAIPIIAPALKNREMREATRLVTSYLGAAKARAVQTGRPVGVMIERFEPSALNGGAFAYQMSQIEVPPPYSGDTMQSKVTIARYPLTGTITSVVNNGSGGIRITINPPPPFPLDDTLTVTITGVQGTIEANGTWQIIPVGGAVFDLKNSVFANAHTPGTGTFNLPCWPCITSFLTPDSWQNVVRYGDLVRIDYRGTYYTLRSVPQSVSGVDPKAGQPVKAAPPGNNTDGYWFLIDPNNKSLDFAEGYVYGAPYQFYRQPTRTSVPPMVLPDGLVFDLSISGVGSTLFNTADYAGTNINSPAPVPQVLFDPQIIFSPSGRVESVTNDQGQLVRATDPIYLLLGRREWMFDVTTRNNTDSRDLVFQNLSPQPPIATPASRMPPALNFWVVVSPQSGQVNTSEIAPHVQDYTNAGGFQLGPAGSTYPPSNLRHVIQLTLFGTQNSPTTLGALSFARESQSLGGR